MILLLVIGDYLRHHKPEDLGPEIRSKIADIANSIPLLLAVICTIVALAGFVTAVIWYNSQTLVRGPSSLLALPATAADPPPYDGVCFPARAAAEIQLRRYAVLWLDHLAVGVPVQRACDPPRHLHVQLRRMLRAFLLLLAPIAAVVQRITHSLSPPLQIGLWLVGRQFPDCVPKHFGAHDGIGLWLLGSDRACYRIGASFFLSLCSANTIM